VTSPAEPTASLDLIHRVLDVDVAYTISRLQVLERLPGNPIGVAYRKVEGTITALMARHIPSPSFNRVVGLRAGDERHIAPLAAWYREHGVTARFEMVPGDCDAALGRELARLGYYQSGFHAALICRPDDAIAAAKAADIERVTSAALMEDYLQAYTAGWGLPEKEHLHFKANVRPWLGQPGWSLYLGRIDGRPAAAATLYVHGGLGYCADATTDPAFRRRGLQLALLHRRIADAGAAGVDFVFSGAEFLSPSHRNMERIGMRLAFIRAIWMPLPAPS
jgi:ribosomal protein S18 acetylase RimI-like enzyme